MTARDGFYSAILNLLVEILRTLNNVHSEISEVNDRLDSFLHDGASVDSSGRRMFHDPPPLPEATVMQSGRTSYFRQPLPDNHFLLGKIIDGETCDLHVEFPTGDRIPISHDDAVYQFGHVRLPRSLSPSFHPSDRALNPEET